MKVKLTIIAFLITISSIAQTGINYKALIKDDVGNVIANEDIQIRFSIIRGSGILAYQETQNITTNDNGLAIVTIGEGTPLGGITFDLIDWGLDSHELAISIDLGSGFIFMGTTEFQAVPYAFKTLNPDGLEAIDEGIGVGWRLAGRDPLYYGNIGENAIDFSTQNFIGDVRGARGIRSVAFGIGTEASGVNSFAMGQDVIAQGDVSVGFGSLTEANGNRSMATGFRTRADANISFSIGRFNIGGGNPTSWIDTDPLFEVGNGLSDSNRNNALTIYKNGRHVIRSSSTGLSILEANTGIIISNSNNNGISIQDSNNNGIEITSPNENGITISNATENGIVASGDNHGARVFGDNAGLYASGGVIGNEPDIILGSPSTPQLSDDGIISTNPERSGSDMFLRSYDAVVVELDYDNNEGGNFIIENGNDNSVFNVNESGDLDISGVLQIGNETLEDGGNDILTFSSSLVPSVDGDDRLGGPNRRWQDVYAVNGAIQTSDKREKKNINHLEYGLAEVLKMQPVSFNWKNKNNPDLKLGLIAQDLQILVPETVHTHIWEIDEISGVLTKKELDRLGVYYSDLVPVLIKAIQEQQKIIENQGEALKASNSNYEALLSRIEDLEANQSN